MSFLKALTFAILLFSSLMSTTFRARDSGVRASWLLLISLIRILTQHRMQVNLRRPQDRGKPREYSHVQHLYNSNVRREARGTYLFCSRMSCTVLNFSKPGMAILLSRTSMVMFRRLVIRYPTTTSFISQSMCQRQDPGQCQMVAQTPSENLWHSVGVLLKI